MPSPRKIKGELVQHERPDWEPLANALLGWFMWMHEVKLADGYREVELDVAILRVLERWRPLEWSDEADRATP